MRLTFDFPAASGAPRRLRLEDPVEVHVAHRLEEVRPALAALEAARARGLTVAGYLAYEAAPAFEPRMRVRTGNRMPRLWFGAFTEARELPAPDEGGAPPETGPADTPTGGVDADGGGGGAGAGHARSRPDGTPPEGWSTEMPRARYEAAVARVREAIAEGRTYQVNLTTRLRALAREDPPALYERLRAAQGAGFHALLELGGFTIVSASPELFFRTRDGV
ncbi:MAG TPA: chorismate-binding protein, partial [Longimicrobiales bacterium]|nr:chorismate-binding protein [Longimicrobiales bacterium]